MHILTYATHNERYFPYLENNEEVTVLGMGEKWTGFRDKVKAVVEFAKKCDSNTYILFVDGFDSVVLGSRGSIASRFEQLQRMYGFDIIFSKDNNANTLITKILQDKYFGSCNKHHLNSGLYMGTASKIIQFWNDFIEDETYENDDQIYATTTCRNDKLKIHIDNKCEMFYNYSEGDEALIQNKNNKLFVKSKENVSDSKSNFDVLVISAPGKGNLENILQTINVPLHEIVKENPKFSAKNVTSSISKHYTSFLFEIFFVFCMLYFLFSTNTFMKKRFLIFQIRYWGIALLFLMLMTYIEYIAFIRSVDISIAYKGLYLFIDYFHMMIVFISYILLYLIFTQKNKINYLLILNTKFLIVLLLFFIYKKCILTMMSSNIVQSDIKFAPIYDRMMYLCSLDYNYDQTANREESLHAWMNGNKFLVGLLIVTNLYVLIKLNYKK